MRINFPSAAQGREKQLLPIFHSAFLALHCVLCLLLNMNIMVILNLRLEYNSNRPNWGHSQYLPNVSCPFSLPLWFTVSVPALEAIGGLSGSQSETVS